MSKPLHLRRLGRDQTGATLVELAVVLALFLLLFFMLLDFGRLSSNWAMAEKAVQMAARMAAVRPAACENVPETNLAGEGNTARYGRSCTFQDAVSGEEAVCAGNPDTPIVCSGSMANATAAAIWNQVGPLMSGRHSVTGAAPSAANLRFTYDYDPAMNFLGGPYVPVVTVELQNLEFEFVSPLLGLARLAGAATDGTGNTPNPLSFPSMSVSLPGEDLALGDAG
jgi:Flp pilus assembly protein TadG